MERSNDLREILEAPQYADVLYPDWDTRVVVEKVEGDNVHLAVQERDKKNVGRQLTITVFREEFKACVDAHHSPEVGE